MLAHVEIDLRDRVAPEPFDEVDEQPELHAPTFDERNDFERAAPRRVLTAERLHDVGELGEEQREQRSRDELGDAAAARGRTLERARVVRLDEHRVGLREQRSAQPLDVLAAEVAQVGVDPADDVAVARVQRLPHRVALARPGAGLGQHGRLADHPRAGRTRRPRRCRRWNRRRAPRPRTRVRGVRLRRRWRRWSPPRSVPAGTRTRRRRLLPCGQSTGICYSSRQRAHRERPRDRPFDAAATSEDPGYCPTVRARCQCLTDEQPKSGLR